MPTKKNPTPAPEVVDPVKGLLVKLISIEYGRKINLETISNKRPYESAERKVTMWADIDPDEQGDANLLKVRLDELHTLVKNAVIASIQETVANVRAADQSLKYSSIAIEQALLAVLKSLIPGEPIEKFQMAEEMFMIELKSAQEFLQSQ